MIEAMTSPENENVRESPISSTHKLPKADSGFSMINK